MSHHNSLEARRGNLIAFLLVSLLILPALAPAATTDNQGSLRITRSGPEVRVFGADSRLAGGLNLGYVPSFVAIHESAHLLYSSDSSGRMLFVHDLSTGALLRQVDLGGKAVAAAFDAQRAQLYVLDQANATIKILDAASLKTRAEARLSGTPVDFAFDASRGTLFVASSGKRLVEISADTLRVQRRVRDLEADAVALHVSHAADLLVVQHEKWVSVYRLSDLKFRDYLPLEGHPQRIQIDPAGTKIYVQLKDETDNVAVFDTASLHPDGWINVARRVFNGRKVDASSFTVDQASGNLVFYDAESNAFFSKQDTTFATEALSTPTSFPVGVTAGSDIQVNPTIDKGAQTVPNAGFDGYGNFAITWSDGAGNDGNGEGVFMRKFLADQTPVAKEFRVNKWKAGDQGTSSLTCADSGSIMVIWRDGGGRDGDGFGVYGRIVNADGTFLTDDFLIPQTTAGRQMAPSVSGTPNGNFVAAWSGPGDGAGRGTWIRLFDASGTPLTNELLANTSITGNTWAVNVNQNRNGDFVVVWRDDSDDRIRGRAFHADGTPVAVADFQAGPMNTSAHDFESGVTVFDDATFIIIWRETSAGGVVAQRFNADQTPNGLPFVVSTKPTGQQFGPAVAGAPDGQFVVTWRDSDYPTDDIVARLFMADGTPNGSDFIVPDVNRAGDEFECTAAMDDAGNFVIAYKDRGGPTSIAARYFMQAPPPTPMQI
ncbi:MAG TPA: hypothetical protein VLR94_08890, partial [Acidobacteriota bacterium]|nr:hypothetical protein [Acidobacteriota bacterium]